jgi:methyltransferase family protein
MTTTAFDQSIAALDVSMFRIESQTSIDDRRSFLTIQNAVRGWKHNYVYLECGSHIGGSLLPHVLDPRCRLAYSIDKRPEVQPDERGVNYQYPNNSSKRMMANLADHATAENVLKVRTFDMDANKLTAAQISEKPDLVLIDAEHTNTAVFSDFLHIYRLCGPDTVYAFHDANLVYSGLQNIEMFLTYSGVAFDSFVFPRVVYVLATNGAMEILRSVGKTIGINKERFAVQVKNQLMRYHYNIVREYLANQAKR